MITACRVALLLAAQSIAFASSIQFADIKTIHTHNDKSKEVIIQREINPVCMKVVINPEQIFGDNMADDNIPDICKRTFATTVGVIKPIKLKGIETAAELEVLELIRKAQAQPQKYILIDARTLKWYEQLTIPTAVNIPFNEIAYDPEFPEDFEKLMKALNIRKEKGKLDFSNAKEAIVFCNGSWCAQSKWAIDALVSLGYPKEKLGWYRGGLQDWLALGLTTVKGAVE